MALLDDARVAVRVTSTAFDAELTDLINAALADMGITNINPALLVSTSGILPLIKKAVITYCKMNFGEIEPEKYDRLKASYDEQKAQLSMSSEYNDGWGVQNDA